jgi:hypothetical protein
MPGVKRFCDALEDSPRLVGIRKELLDNLGDEYPIAAPFLCPNGKEARRYPCPSPGDPGCPRRIVRESADRFRAVWAAESRECDTLRLAREDVQVLAFDDDRFAHALQPILGITVETPQLKHRGNIAYLGVVRVRSGARLPVVLLMASSRPVAQALLAEAERTYRKGAILLTPTDELIDGEMESRLADSGFTWLVLANMLSADGKKLTAKQPLSELVAQPAVAAPHSAITESVHRFLTPPDIDWKDIQIRFTDGNTVTINVGAVTKRVTYAEMNMKQTNSGQPTLLWRLLRDFAERDGRFDWGNPNASRRIKQRVCRLRKTLKAYFGLDADPFFKYQRGVGYRVKFKLTPER